MFDSIAEHDSSCQFSKSYFPFEENSPHFSEEKILFETLLKSFIYL